MRFCHEDFKYTIFFCRFRPVWKQQPIEISLHCFIFSPSVSIIVNNVIVVVVVVAVVVVVVVVDVFVCCSGLLVVASRCLVLFVRFISKDDRDITASNGCRVQLLSYERTVLL